jgi:superfamily I DNA/RNA helicase
MQWLMAAQGGDELAQERVAAKVEAVVRAVREEMAGSAPDRRTADALTNFVIDAVGERAIRRATPAYSRDMDFARVKGGFSLLMQDSAQGAADWTEALDRFDGVDQVPVMTVHKAKGLEFHTVIFFGLDSSSWEGLEEQAPEEVKTFFVALTRAQQRAFFTHCTGRGVAIEWLDELCGNLLPRRPLGGAQDAET